MAPAAAKHAAFPRGCVFDCCHERERVTVVEQLLQQVRIGARRLGHGVLARPFVRHVGVLTVANGVGAILSFVQGILVARWLGPELYGVAALVMSVPSLVYTFFDARSAEASVKFLSEFDARGEWEKAVAMCRLGYLIDFIIAALAFLGVLAITPWASRSIVHRPELAWLLVLYASAFVFRSPQGTSSAVLAVHRRFPTIAFIQILATTVRVGLVLGLVITGWEVIGVVIGNAVGIALMGALYALAAVPLIHRSWGDVPWSSTWSVLRGHRREVLRFFVYNDLSALLGMIPKQVDIVLLGYFRPAVEVGYYKLAKSLAASLGLIVSPLQSVVYPDLSRMYGTGAIGSFYDKLKRLTLFVGFPLGAAVLIVIPFAHVLIPVLADDAYAPAVPLVQALFGGYAVWLLFFALRPAYLGSGAVKQWTIGIGVYAVFFALLAFLLVPTIGAMGLVVTQVIVTVAFHTIMGGLLYVSRRDSRASV